MRGLRWQHSGLASNPPEAASCTGVEINLPAHGHDAYVLGARGCGAFGKDGRVIARLFGEALDGAFRGVFAEVVFAVTDWSDDQRFIVPFAERFGACGTPKRGAT